VRVTLEEGRGLGSQFWAHPQHFMCWALIFPLFERVAGQPLCVLPLYCPWTQNFCFSYAYSDYELASRTLFETQPVPLLNGKRPKLSWVASVRFSSLHPIDCYPSALAFSGGSGSLSYSGRGIWLLLVPSSLEEASEGWEGLWLEYVTPACLKLLVS
jgi:hypothetical protein